MESYEYGLLAKIILEAKKLIPDSIPLHLFGAGHPLTIPIAIALGYDTFDSASYMLYAKHDRYISDDRTNHLTEMQYFGCNCEVCTKYTPKSLSELPPDERIPQIALHNLYAIKSEVDRTKEAIHEGRLWEYIVKKIKAHPKLYETLEVFTANSEFLAKTTPKFKDKALFLYTGEDQFRPEIITYHKTVRNFTNRQKGTSNTEGCIRQAILSLRRLQQSEEKIQRQCPVLPVQPIPWFDTTRDFRSVSSSTLCHVRKQGKARRIHRVCQDLEDIFPKQQV